MYSLYWLRRSRTSSLRRSSTANSSEMTSAIFSATRSGFDVSMVPGVRLFTSCLEMYETNSLASSMLCALNTYGVRSQLYAGGRGPPGDIRSAPGQAGIGALVRPPELEGALEAEGGEDV